MKKFICIGLGIVAAVMVALPTRAQVVYSCDFEDPNEVSQWTLNAGRYAYQCLCQWIVGEPGNFSQKGKQGLFVSSDSVNATYVSTQAFNVVSYRELTLPVGQYYLDFDWRSMGGSLQYVGVAWVSQTQATNSLPSGMGAPAWFTNANGQTYRGSKAWNSAHMTIDVTQANTAGKLVFIWISGLDNSKPKNPSGCVDNIVIRNIPASSCSKPTNLTYNEQTAKLSWNSSATLFQVRDYCVNDGNLVEYDSVANKYLNLQLETEGTHTFYVRSICDDGNYSEWVSISTFLWIPGLRCIEYLDIGNKSHAGVCYTGNFDDFIKNGRQGTMRAAADTDPSSDESMHVIHTDINELDPQTINSDGSGGLPTVPEGEIAAVRLGAYTSSGLSAAIEYKYKVQQGMSDLLDLNYAVVMESGGHGEDYRVDQDQQPTFQLFVLDGQGQLLESSCTHLNIKCGFGDTQSWHWVDNASPTQSGAVCYSDWQKVTISLRPYVGQTLTIRLLSSRCSYDTHPAHAYFTMSCRSGNLEGLACGDFSTDHFDAPEGFNYRWYLENDPTRATLSTDRTLHIPSDDSLIYMVECHSLVDNSCYFTLTANPNPRFPMAIGDTIVSSTNCQNLVTFTNASVVRVVNRKSGQTMSVDEPIYTCLFDYGDGAQEEMTGLMNQHEYPATGGTFHAMMIASMNDGICQDTLHYDIVLPDMVHTGTSDTAHVCRGEAYPLPSGDVVYDDTIYVSYSLNQYGCQAPDSLYVIFHDSVSHITDTTFCEGGYIDFEGKRYTQTGVYPVQLHTQYGCDSTLTLNLTVIPRLEVMVPDTVTACGDFGHGEAIYIPLSVIKGQYNGASVIIDNGSSQKHRFDSIYTFGPQDSILIPVPDSVTPNYYKVLLDPSTDACPTDSVYLILFIKYSSQILAQKYGFVALLNADYNYGEFSYLNYEWYRNDSLLANEHQSYLHVTDEDLNSAYRVVITRVGDGLRIPSCELIYTSTITALDNMHTPASVTPTLLTPGQTMQLTGSGEVAIVDMLGRTIRTQVLGKSELSLTMNAPQQEGIYYVVFNHDEAIKILVR